MPPFLSKQSRIKLKVLAWYQIIGGIMGILVTIWLVAQLGQINGLILLILLFATSLYVFSIYCGRLLLTDKYLTGFKLTIINQVIQIPQFAMLGYAFWYVSGCMVTIGINVDHGFGFDFNFHIMSTYQISVATSETTFKLAINLFAIYLVHFTEKLRTMMKEEKASFDELEISNELKDERLAYEG